MGGVFKMDKVTWPQIITAIVAVYGAIMSTITFIINRKEKIRQISVTFSNGSLVYTSNNRSDLMLFITVANPGNRPVTINVPRIRLPNKRTFVFPNPQSNVNFPHRLEDGADCVIWIDMELLARQLKSSGFKGRIKLIAEVNDATGKIYSSKKKWTLDIDQWIK